MRALDLKLLRDFWHLRGQVLAIAGVIMGGVATLVMSLSTYDSLITTRDRFYSENRFADVFANLKRAPDPVAERLRAIPGVAHFETRVIASEDTLNAPEKVCWPIPGGNQNRDHRVSPISD